MGTECNRVNVIELMKKCFRIGECVMAIQPTNAGIDFQQRVSALMMICMEFEIDIDMFFEFQIKDKIEKLNFEASDKIDDLVITTNENKKYIFK